jgi:hypothetical protein
LHSMDSDSSTPAKFTSYQEFRVSLPFTVSSSAVQSTVFAVSARFGHFFMFQLSIPLTQTQRYGSSPLLSDSPEFLLT